MSEHVIQMDFRNTYGQNVYVLDCPVAGETLVIAATRNHGVCNCGHRI